MVRREARRSMLAVSAASPASQDSSSVTPAASCGSSAPAECASPSPTNVCHSSSRSCSALSSCCYAAAPPSTQTPAA
eukprot:4497128-Pleurochrysis_carterae.AAC.1